MIHFKQINSANGLSSKTWLNIKLRPVRAPEAEGYFIEHILTQSTVNEFIPRLENASCNRHILELLLLRISLICAFRIFSRFRPSNAVRKREKIRNAHISEMRSKLPVVDVIFLTVYRWSKAIEYFLRIVLLNTFLAALNILRCNLLNISDIVLNI
jgi:hypothetical protein